MQKSLVLASMESNVYIKIFHVCVHCVCIVCALCVRCVCIVCALGVHCVCVVCACWVWGRTRLVTCRSFVH